MFVCCYSLPSNNTSRILSPIILPSNCLLMWSNLISESTVLTLALSFPFDTFPAYLFSTFSFSLTQTRSYKQTAKQANCTGYLFRHCPSLHYLSNSALPFRSYYSSLGSCPDGDISLLKFSLVSLHICFLYYQSFSFFIYIITILNYPNTSF